MTQEEVARRIVKQDGCNGISCCDDNCPIKHDTGICYGVGNPYRASWHARKWLESHGGNMDKKAAIKRLDAIEEEAAKLREIIEKGDKIVYDSSKVYIGLRNGRPYIMAGKSGTQSHFNMHSFDNGSPTCVTYTDDSRSGQACIDISIEKGFTIHVFDDTKEALQFFIDHL